jgi:Tfp pilus assembly protein PilO
MRKVVALYFAGGVALILGAFLFLISPQINKRREIKASYAAAQEQLEDFRRTLARFPELFSDEKILEQRRRQLATTLFSKEELLVLFGSLEKMALERDLVLLEITPSIEELLALHNRRDRDNNLPQLNLAVRVSGSFKDIGEYIKTVERESFYNGLNFCRIAASENGNSFPKAEFGFRVILRAEDEI